MPFLCEGVVVATENGEVPARGLRVGDRIVTRQNGLQTVRWIGTRRLTAAEIETMDHLRPLLVPPAGLDGWQPETEIRVSPNQRILVPRDRSLIHFEEHEALVSAKHLADNRKIRAEAAAEATYLHFLLDRHELVLVNGAWCEAFHPGDIAMNGLGNAQRFEIQALFPQLREIFPEPARAASPGRVIPMPQRH